jgi:hypothetical protein
MSLRPNDQNQYHWKVRIPDRQSNHLKIQRNRPNRRQRRLQYLKDDTFQHHQVHLLHHCHRV